MSNIIQQLSKTDLLKDTKTQEILNRILYKSYHESKDEEEIKTIGAIALKYGLECADEIIDTIKFEGFPMPF